MEIKSLESSPPFVTKDGSEIRELLAYRNSSIRNQSLAEARLPAGASTQEHYHAKTEEIYFITAGRGRMRIEETVEHGRRPADIALLLRAVLRAQRHLHYRGNSSSLIWAS
jgi:mannose-6-phosphate isomerase-like protein (cupin superfamily)